MSLDVEVRIYDVAPRATIIVVEASGFQTEIRCRFQK